MQCMYMHVFVRTCMYMHVHACICMYMHVYVQHQQWGTASCPFVGSSECLENRHNGLTSETVQALPALCIYMYLHEFTCIYMHIHADTCRYIHIHTYTYIYIHIHADSDTRCSQAARHFTGTINMGSLHWGHWHGIPGNHFTGVIATGLRHSGWPGCSGPTMFYFRNSCKTLKSSARRYDPQLALLSKAYLPGFLLTPIFHWLIFFTDQLSWFYLQSSFRILPKLRKLHHVILQVLHSLTWSIYILWHCLFICCVIR